MNVMIEWVLVIALVTSGTALVLVVVAPPIEQMQSSFQLTEVERTFGLLTSAIESVGQEGTGSTRTITIPSSTSGQWKLSPDENLLEFITVSNAFPPLSRNFITPMFVVVAGADANCYSGTFGTKAAWIMENTYIKVYLQRIENDTIDTSKNIFAIHSKVLNKTLIPEDTSIMIDKTPSTSAGKGFSEMKIGNNRPRCRTRFFVNSTSVSYEIFYTLYAGADFVIVEVRNIK